MNTMRPFTAASGAARKAARLAKQVTGAVIPPAGVAPDVPSAASANW
jgi:hypothetical protein